MTERSRAVSARSIRVWLIAAAGAGVLAALTLVPGCGAAKELPKETRDRRLLIIGIDGMDAGLTRQMMDEGRLPNFARLAAEGGFSPLATSMPPESPVAWSNFISGDDPGSHQIYDFIHREANPAGSDGAIAPFLSTSRTEACDGWLAKLLPNGISVGKWNLPLASARTELLRRGDAWWNHLVAHGIDTSVFRVPGNYPAPQAPGPGRWHCLAGMGTPDILGTYGEFTVFTPKAPLAGRSVGGGRFVHLDMRDDRATVSLQGLENPLRRPGRDGRRPLLSAPIEIVRDPVAAVAKITVGDQVLLLREGEWSDWTPFRFETELPGSSVAGAVGIPTSSPAMVRLLLKQVHPDLELYVSPLNIDPLAQATPISEPADWASELSARCGEYYTTGIPEDTKALREGALNEDQFLQQVKLVSDERERQYWDALERFQSGCLYFYFGHTDSLSHMFWRDRDPEHPGRLAEQGDTYAKVIEDAYVGMDTLLGQTRQRLKSGDTLIVLSDHGFASFRRGINLNRWLLDNGYLAVFARADKPRELTLDDIDWTHTRAYGLGLNSVYLNLRGREKFGIVAPDAEREALLKELSEKLLGLRDGENQPIRHVYRVDQCYPTADPAIAPDLLVGYERGYRASWATVLGGIAPELIEDNKDRWSGDHLMDSEVVPGVLFSNRRITSPNPSLSDLAPSILQVYGIQAPAAMKGHNILAEFGSAAAGPKR